MVFGCVAGCQRGEAGACGRCDRIEDAQQGLAVPSFVAFNQLGIVEIVTRIHPDAFGQAAAHVDLFLRVQQRDFDTFDCLRIGLDQAERGLHRLSKICSAPIARERRIEHLAQPVQNDGMLGLGEYGGIDFGVVGW